MTQILEHLFIIWSPWSYNPMSFQFRSFFVEWNAVKKCLVKALIATYITTMITLLFSRADKWKNRGQLIFKYSTQIFTFWSAKTGLRFKAKCLLKLNLDPVFPSVELVSIFYSPKLTPTKRFYSWYTTTSLNSACQHYPEIAQSYTLAALIRLSTTTHNLLTFNRSEISSNNSEKLSLLADNTSTHLSYTRLIQVPRYTATRTTVACEHALSRSLVCRPA